MRVFLQTTTLMPLDSDYFESPVHDFIIHPDFNEKSFVIMKIWINFFLSIAS